MFKLANVPLSPNILSNLRILSLFGGILDEILSVGNNVKIDLNVTFSVSKSHQK